MRILIGNKYRLSFSTAATVLAMSPSALADITVFDDEADFLASADVVSTETFDDFAEGIAGVGTVIIDDVTYTSSDGANWIIDTTFGNVSPPYNLHTGSIHHNTLSFGEHGTTTAIGFYLVSGDEWLIRVETVDETFMEHLDADAQATFRGYLAPEGIVSLRYADPSGDNHHTNWGWDNVSRAAITVDCNGNGIHDGDDIANGTSQDTNGNGIPDECEDCLWDLDGDGNVGTGDLILVLGSWGDPYGTEELIELFGNWGPCE